MTRFFVTLVAAATALTLLPARLAVAKTDLCAENRYSVAVVVGNKDYQGRVPEVPFAVNDARAIKTFLIDSLCYREGNILFMENATYGKLLSTFGSVDSPMGKLWNWVRPKQSNVFVYYSGHGAPDIRTGDGFLVPVDGNPDNPSLGYSLQTLVTNLKNLKQQRVGDKHRVTLVLDACFSGREGTGKALIKGSFSGWRPRRPDPGSEIVQFSAAAADEIARWDEMKEHGLFTRVFLDGIRGEADKAGTGNGDGTVSGEELTGFLRDEVSYLARRRYGEEQTPDLPEAEQISWRFPVRAAPPPVPKKAPAPPQPDPMVVELELWDSIKGSQSRIEFEDYLRQYPRGRFAELARLRIEELTPKPPPPDPATIELALWNSIKDSRNKAVFENYLRKYPDGIFADVARLKIDELTPKRAAPTPVPQQGSADCGHPFGPYKVRGVAWNDVLNIRKGPGTKYSIVYGIPPDGEGISLGECTSSGKWCRVRYKCHEGWSSRKYLTSAASGQAAVSQNGYRVAGIESWDVLYIRTGPAKEYSSIGSIPYNGTDVTVHRCRKVRNYKYKWCHVSWHGTSGWSYARYLVHMSAGHNPN